MFAPRPDRHHLHRTAGLETEAVADYAARMRLALDQSIDSLRNRTLLISGEDISVLPPDSLVRLRDYLRARLSEITIVGYVRPPAAFISSGFQQRVQTGSVVQINPEGEYRKYREYFDPFDEIFGRENVHLWKFDPITFPGGCAVRDFCARLDIALPSKRIYRLNDSLSWQSIAMLYVYNKLRHKYGFSIMGGSEAQELGNRLTICGADKFRFSMDVIRPVLEKNRADIQWMEHRLGHSLHEELGEHQLGDVRDESDLLRPDPALVSKLLELLRDAAPSGVRGDTIDEVVLLVHAFRQAISRQEPTDGRGIEAGKTRQQDRSQHSTTPRSGPSLIVAFCRKLTTTLLSPRRSNKKS